MFRTLEECKRKTKSHAEIPKNDRLEIREEIKKQPRELIELFRHYRKNPSTPMIDSRKPTELSDSPQEVLGEDQIGKGRLSASERQGGAA
jgi:hypothetical protein